MVDVKTPYDLKPIVIKGVTIMARPVAWDRPMIDNEGHVEKDVFAEATEYETACPHCGQLVRFSAAKEQIKCPECKAGEDVYVEKFESPFIDPGEYAVAPVATPVPDATLQTPLIAQIVEKALSEPEVKFEENLGTQP